MGSSGFQRFVAIFVGALLLFAIFVAIVTGDEGMIGTIIAVAIMYVVYLTVLFRKEKERRSRQAKQADSPLLRR